jgi:hypothetical protein
MAEIDFKYITQDNKYSLIFYKSGKFEALRYGQPWRDLTGDGLVLALVSELIELKHKQEANNKG